MMQWSHLLVLANVVSSIPYWFKRLCVAADVFLWRDKKLSAAVLGVATAIWVLFELVEYHFLSLVCHILIFSLAAMFLWSNAHAFMNK